MNNIIKDKLLRDLQQFIDLPLKVAQFKVEKDLKTQRDLLILELTFSDNGLWKTMVLVLDKEFTEKNDPVLADRLTR